MQREDGRRPARGLRIAGAIARMVFPPDERAFARFRRFDLSRRGRAPRGVRLQTVHIQSREAARSIRVCLYSRPGRSATDPDLPVLLYLHGGGYVIGSPDSEQAYVSQILRDHDCLVVAPDYRLAPEHPYPAALEDCHDTLRWAVSDAADAAQPPLHDDGKRRRAGVVGVSAGGGLALGLALLARDLGEKLIGFCGPLYPMIDCRMTTASMRGNRMPMWNELHSAIAWPLYLPDGEATLNAQYASASLASDLTGLPPLFSFVGSLDPFFDEDTAFFERAANSGVDTTFTVFQGAYHAFEVLAPFAPVSKQARQWFGESLRTVMPLLNKDQAS